MPPTFPQFAIESFLAFLLLLGYFRLTNHLQQGLKAKRWQLRCIPVLACSLPLLPALFAEADTIEPMGVQIMSYGQWMNFQIPEFSIKISTVVLAIYFAGVVYTSFRLVDRLWLVSQFLQKKGNQASSLSAWQGNPTALLGHLMLNWELMSKEEKEKWAHQWLPIHPIFGWEALLVELSLVGNWWNPLAYQYRQHWASLYADWQMVQRPKARFLTSYMLGFGAFGSGLAILFAVLPTSTSPLQQLGELAVNFFDKTILENVIEKPHEYTVEWGDLKLPLKKFANPNGYSAEMEVELTDFQKIIKKELRLFRDGKPMTPGTLSVIYKSNQRGKQAYINGIDPKEVKLLERQTGVIFNDSLGLGDELVLFGDSEDIYLSSVEIRIKDPEAGYVPLIFVPEISSLEANMHYQIVARRGKRALVKIDPEHPNAARILQLYGDERQYEIVYLPGFRTNRHYLTEAETLASKVAAANTDLTFMERDAFYLSEYQSYQGKEVRMFWGEMTAATSSQNYSLDSFLISLTNEPQLLVGEDTLELVSFELIIAGKNRTAKSYQTYRIADLNLRGVFQNLQENTSIYFDKIVVKDSSQNLLLFPAAFAFNIGKPNKSNEYHFMSGKNFIMAPGAKPKISEVYFKSQDSMPQDFRKRISK